MLNYFLTVVREESISKAAAVLHITQPTLSRQLVGYSNFSYFSKTFRDLTGVTPNEYRLRKAKESNQQ